ncbi:MAG: hypothetical protein IIB19_01605 [Chloroflexi bacterium]|nr:hypothetical protein [Chloroflexota bacterium]
MLRRISLAFLPLALLAAACIGGGSESATDERATPEPTSPPPISSSATYTPEPTSPPPASISATDTVEPGGAANALLEGLNPLQLLDSFGQQPTSQQVDPSLKAALLDADDLPAGFVSLGQSTLTIPGDIGPMEMAASQFVIGDLEGDFGGMVMSAVMSLPPEALAELGDLSDLEAAMQAEFSQGIAEAEQLGLSLGDFQLLDASGLGDGGLGMHMELDFGALLDELATAFDAPEEEIPAVGFVIEMYMFLRGEQMLIVIVMETLEQSTGVDARELAETMDAKAAAAS